MGINLYDYEFRTYYDAHGLAKDTGCFIAEVIGWEDVKGDGQTPDEAVRECRISLELNIEVNQDRGTPIPPPVRGVSAAAASLGRLGGKTMTPARLAANRRNGQRGGRPKKQPVAAAA